MTEETRPIAIIPSDCFRWQPRVQFIDSFRTREAALNCALEHGYNLIVERSEGSNALFDVVDDPDATCTAGLELELFKNEEILVDPYAGGWTSLMLSSLWQLAVRLATAVSGLYVLQVAPRLRQAASSSRPAIERALRHTWRRMTRPSDVRVRSFSWQSPIPASCRTKTLSLSAARVRARRTSARLAAFCHREIVPFCRSAALRCWWSGGAIALRRGWHRHSHGNVRDLAKRLAAIMASLYRREVAPRLRHVVSRVRQADFEVAFQHAWTTSLITSRDLARRFGATADSLYTCKIAPRLSQAVVRCRHSDIQNACRRAWRSTLLAAIRLTDRFATAVAALYLRQVAPRLRRAAVRYQQADFEGALRRRVEVVAPPRHSNAS